MPTTEFETFLETTLAHQLQAERALHNGNVVPRLSTWSHRDPVTVFGAGVACRTGWDDIRPVFDRLAASFTGCDDYDYELVAGDARGDLAYTVGIERYRATTSSGAIEQNALRVTHVYRREDGEWKIVHRHGDHMTQAP